MFSQSRRRPLLGPSPGWKCLLALSHSTLSCWWVDSRYINIDIRVVHILDILHLFCKWQIIFNLKNAQFSVNVKADGSFAALVATLSPDEQDTWAQWPVASHTEGPGTTCRPLIPLTNTSTTVGKQTQSRCANNVYRVGSKTSINNRCCKSWCNLVNIVSMHLL